MELTNPACKKMTRGASEAKPDQSESGLGEEPHDISAVRHNTLDNHFSLPNSV